MAESLNGIAARFRAFSAFERQCLACLIASIVVSCFLISGVSLSASADRANSLRQAQKKISTVLAKAIKAGNARQVERLLAKGVDPNSTDRSGRPVIFLVTEAPATGWIHGSLVGGGEQTITKHLNHAKIVMLLVKHGAHVNVKDKSGWTPLTQAEEANETQLVLFLKKAGAK